MQNLNVQFNTEKLITKLFLLPYFKYLRLRVSKTHTTLLKLYVQRYPTFNEKKSHRTIQGINQLCPVISFEILGTLQRPT